MRYVYLDMCLDITAPLLKPLKDLSDEHAQIHDKSYTCPFITQMGSKQIRNVSQWCFLFSSIYVAPVYIKRHQLMAISTKLSQSLTQLYKLVIKVLKLKQ